MVCGKNRFSHPFSVFTFVETIQVIRFYKRYKLWKSRLPHRLFNLCGFGWNAINCKTKIAQTEVCATWDFRLALMGKSLLSL